MTVDVDARRRTEIIESYGVLGRPMRDDLAALADLAARICDVPMAAINLLTDTEQHHAAAVGLAPVVCGIDESMCAAVIDEPPPVVVPDCRLDPRLAHNPFVDGRFASVVFYASWRLTARSGVVLGTLCVFDERTRVLDKVQTDALATLADRVVDVLDLSLRSRELSATLLEVERVRVELERSNVRLASFAGQISHDLRTPLTSMILSMSLIREELAEESGDSRALPLLDRAIAGSTRMASLIDDVLTFAMLGDLQREEVDLDVVLRNVRADLWDHLVGAVVTSDPLPTVMGDEVQLRAVIQNLADNAVKYADPERPLCVHLSSQRLADGWRIEVTDNGRGVDPVLREKVFEPLVRSDTSVGGSGIGLATCRRVVEAHGGRIGLDPAPGGGTTVWFELPD